MKLHQWVRICFSTFLSVLFLWLLVRQIELSYIESIFSAIDAKWIVAALCGCSGSFACRVQRWRALMIHDNPTLKWTTCAGPMLAGFFGNNVLPFRAGDILRAFAFTRELGLSSGSVLATLVAERLLDLLVVLGLLAVVLLILPTDMAPFVGVAVVVFASIVAVIFWGVLFRPLLFAKLARPLSKSAEKFAPQINNLLITESEKAFLTLKSLSRSRSMIEPASWSVAAWLVDAIVFWLLARSLENITVPAASWLALPCAALASLIPSTPGNVGTFDYFVARAMMESGNSLLGATAYALLTHVTMWFPQTVCGAFFLALRAIKRKHVPAF